MLLVSNLLYPDGSGGAERYVSELASELRREHDVTVFTGSPGGSTVVTSRRFRRLRADASIGDKVAWHLRDQWHPGVERELRQLVRRFKPDVVHSHEIQGLSAAVFTAIARAGVPHVHTAHDFNLLCVRTTMTVDGAACHGRCLVCRLQRAVRVRAALARLDWLIAPSAFVLERHLQALGFSRERASLIPQGTPTAAGRKRGVGAVSFGFIGSLERHKGLHTLLRAFSRSRCTRLEVAGSGGLESEVRGAAVSDPRIRFWGRVDGDRREAFFDAVDVLVIPSEWEENAPLVAVEAAMRGIPAVVTARGGLPETPEALVVAANDEKALLDGLEACAGAPSSVRKASEQLLCQRDAFSWETHVARVDAVLQRASSGATAGVAA